MTYDGRLDRRTFLRAAGLAAALGAGVTPLACDESPTRRSGAAELLDLSFRPRARFRPFQVVSPGFEQVVVGKPATLRSVTRTSQRPMAPFVAVELAVAAADGDVVAGLFTGADDAVLLAYSARRRSARIEVRRPGRTEVLAERPVQAAPPFRLAFVACENQVTGLVHDGKDWQAVVTDRDGVAATVDLRDPDTLSAYGYGWGAEGGRTRLDEVRAGPFGMAGLRDPHLVQRPDGTPYLRDGRAYLTFTCAGLGFFQQAHWGVFTLDLKDPTSVEQVAHLYAARDGRLLGDHAGQLIVEDGSDGPATIAMNSSWGDFAGNGVAVRHVRTSDDLLSGLHLLRTQPLDLPTSDSSWDPAAARIGDRWHVAFVESPSQDPFDFHPTLAAGPSGAAYDEKLELLGADTSLHQGEGTILQRVGSRWHLLASDGEAREYPVYNLSVERIGELDAPYGTNIPHPQLVQRPGGGWLMVTFNGTQFAEELLGYGTHGDVVVLSSSGRWATSEPIHAV